MKETSHIHCSFQAIFANKVIEQISVRFLDLGSPQMEGPRVWSKFEA